jgi:hypothetical protein
MDDIGGNVEGGVPEPRTRNRTRSDWHRDRPKAVSLMNGLMTNN